MDTQSVVIVNGESPVGPELPRSAQGPLLRIRIGQVRIVDTDPGTERQTCRKRRMCRQRIREWTICPQIRRGNIRGGIDKRVGKLEAKQCQVLEDLVVCNAV